MIHKKQLFHSSLFAALLCGAPIFGLHAQDANGDRPHPRHEPPPSPLFDALDTNHDGILSADEIANASAALKSLLKDGATQLTRDDLRPPRPAAREGQDRDEQAPPRPHEDADRADRPMHRPPPRREAGDDRAMDDPARPHHPRDADREDRAPRPADDADRPEHRREMRSPLFDALDANHDGVISADEIANAPASLKKLDRSGSGQIRRDDLRLPPPPREND